MNSHAYEDFKTKKGFNNPAGQVERLLKLSILLKYTKHTQRELAELCKVHIRTIRRDIKVLQRFYDLSFDDNNCPSIDGERPKEGLILRLTTEEMSFLARLVNETDHEFKEALLQKLDRSKIKHFSYNSTFAGMINTITWAINNKKSIRLEGYKGSKNRVARNIDLEPVHLIGLETLCAFDPLAKKVKTYRLERVEYGVEILDKAWIYESHHENIEVDIFGWHSGPAELIKLGLSTTARSLLQRDNPKAMEYVQRQNDQVYPYILETEIYNPKGAARFVMGLPREIKIIKGNGLKDYIEREIRDLLN